MAIEEGALHLIASMLTTRNGEVEAQGNCGLQIGGIMNAARTEVRIQREPELLGQTVVLIGGSSGIGLETARRARAEGAKVILTGRSPERLRRAATELDAFSTAAFDATDFKLLERFFEDLAAPVDHVLVTGPGP